MYRKVDKWMEHELMHRYVKYGWMNRWNNLMNEQICRWVDS